MGDSRSTRAVQGEPGARSVPPSARNKGLALAMLLLYDGYGGEYVVPGRGGEDTRLTLRSRLSSSSRLLGREAPGTAGRESRGTASLGSCQSGRDGDGSDRAADLLSLSFSRIYNTSLDLRLVHLSLSSLSSSFSSHQYDLLILILSIPHPPLLPPLSPLPPPFSPLTSLVLPLSLLN